MKIFSVLKKMFSPRKDVQKNEHEELNNEELSQVLLSEEPAIAQDSDNKEDDQSESVESKKELSIKNIKNMLSIKSELLKEGKEIVELIQKDGGDLNYSIGRRENESDDEFENRQQQRQLLIDRYLDWAEYARLYIFKYQIIPTHYDEYMASYKSNRYGVWFVKKTLRIIETCK